MWLAWALTSWLKNAEPQPWEAGGNGVNGSLDVTADNCPQKCKERWDLLPSQGHLIVRGVKSHGVRSQSSKPNCRLSLQVKGGLAFFYKGSTSRAVTLCDGSDHIPHFSQGSVTT